jgi:protein-S-isoprenylcysteine O-methyltransferase Ste14
MNTMTAYQITALAIMALFYVIYLQRQFALRKRGIRTDRLGKGDKERTTRIIEVILLIITFSMPIAQVASIVWNDTYVPVWMSLAGATIALIGVLFFLLAVVAMQDNWRAGIDHSQKTKLVTHSVYRISRNPAFVGFDLFYIGIAVMFPNPVLLAMVLVGLILFHLQILQEERYTRQTFGKSYADYARRTRRYI